MAENLSYSIFPLKNEVNENDAYREGSLLLEYFQATVTIATNEGTVEVPTVLDEVIGVLDAGYIASLSDPTDTVKLITDGVITTSAVTVAAKTVDISNGDITIRGFLIGKRKMSAIS